MKRAVVIVLSIIATLVGLLLLFYFITRPPNEATLLRTFYAHRASLEQLRDMLQEEQGIVYVSDRGQNPVNITGERLQRYLALMKSIPAITAERWEKTPRHPARIVIALWGVGFGGDGAHSGVCWTDERPIRQVSSLDAFNRNPRSSIGRGWVFRHIDDDWYLWTDRQTGQSD